MGLSLLTSALASEIPKHFTSGQILLATITQMYIPSKINESSAENMLCSLHIASCCCTWSLGNLIDERWLFQRMGIGTYPWGSHELAREKETKWILELWTESPHLVDFISSNHVGPHCRMMCGCWRLCQRLEPLRLSCNCACCIELSQILYKAM